MNNSIPLDKTNQTLKDPAFHSPGQNESPDLGGFKLVNAEKLKNTSTHLVFDKFECMHRCKKEKNSKRKNDFIHTNTLLKYQYSLIKMQRDEISRILK